ncbi:glycosyltransferase family 39 protein [uncultured Desulfobacter sp.]|uniref:glycosyltransferase family 39 protein n=1 Tax=uncultured Desulfobacter sp. TaxID=240139 RepID=UPI0029F4E452|nr:glycosyltransferase family 39 protein [uncultured Desulfobacter sp.]
MIAMNIKNLKYHDIFILCSLVILGLLFFFKSGVATSGDSSVYLNQGLKLYSGIGYDFYERGPVFPVFIAISFKLFGPTVKSAFFVVRLFLILNWLIIYLLSKKIFSRSLAIAVLPLIITSYGINMVAEFMLLDIVVLFFILLFFYFIILSYEKNKSYLFATTGFLLGFSILVKEVSLIFIPIPIFIFLSNINLRNLNFFKKNIVLYSATVTILLIWSFYIKINSSSDTTLVSMGGQYYLDQILPNGYATNSIFIEYFNDLFKQLKFVYDEHIKTTSYFLAPFFVIAWILEFIRFIKKRDFISSFKISVFACSLPLLIGVGGMQSRIGQIAYFLVFCYIILVNQLYYLLDLMIRKYKFKISEKNRLKSIRRVIVIAFVLFVSCVQVFNGDNPSLNIFSGKHSNNLYKNVSFFFKDFKVTGRHKSSIENACAWLKVNQEYGQRLKLLTTKSLFNSVEFFTQYIFDNIPFNISKNDNELMELIHKKEISKNSHILFIYSHEKFGSKVDRYNNLNFVFEHDLLDILNNQKPDYLILSHYDQYLELYLKNTKHLDKVYDDRDIILYKLNTKKNLKFKKFEMTTSDIYHEKLETRYRAIFKYRYDLLSNILEYFNFKPNKLIDNCYFNKNLIEILETLDKKFIKKLKIGIVGINNVSDIIISKHFIELVNIEESPNKISEKYDILIVSGKPKKFNNIFRLVEFIKPIMSFPRVHYLGSGTMVYNLSNL